MHTLNVTYSEGARHFGNHTECGRKAVPLADSPVQIFVCPCRGSISLSISCFPVALFCSPSKPSLCLISTLSSPAGYIWKFLWANSSTVPATCGVPTWSQILWAWGKSLAPSLPSSLLEIFPYFSLETRADQAKPALQASRWLAVLKNFSKLKLS